MSIYYNSVKDSLVAFFYDEDMYDEKVDEVLTVFRSFAEKRIVGIEIHGISGILSSPEALKCAVLWEDGGTIVAIPLELARRHVGSSLDLHAPAIDAVGSRAFKLPDELRR
jgi:hypothetical protein